MLNSVFKTANGSFGLSMKINLLAFAGLKDALGFEKAELELPNKATVEDALTWLTERHPQIKPIASVLCAAIDQEFAEPTAPLHDGCELALFTPVGGG